MAAFPLALINLGRHSHLGMELETDSQAEEMLLVGRGQQKPKTPAQQRDFSSLASVLRVSKMTTRRAAGERKESRVGSFINGGVLNLGQ